MLARFTPAISKLVAELSHLPGIGPKTAQRLAFYLLSLDEEKALAFADAIIKAKQKVHFCSECFNFTESEKCDICTDTTRDQTLLCVVESPKDVAAMEKAPDYRGLYHVLHGAISPMNNVGPEDIKLRELLQRLHRHPEIQELILATNSTVEGEATAMYIARLLKDTGIRLTRLAHGIPMGADLEYADEETLTRAFHNRTPF